MGLKEQYLKAGELKRATLDVPEWGGAVTVRELTGLERDRYQCEAIESTEDGKLRVVPRLDNAQVVAWGVIDPDTGASVFGDDDLPALGRKSGAVLERIAARVLELSGLRGDGEKNSGTTPTASPSSTSPSPSATPPPAA